MRLIYMQITRRLVSGPARCGALAVALTVAMSAPGAAAPQRDAFDSTPIEVTGAQSKAVADGLDWLAANQSEDGSWSGLVGYKLNSDYRTTSNNQGPHVGVTSLACMAFLAGGNLPGRGRYGQVVERGLRFVLNAAQNDGYITYDGTRMYSHAFATLFLAEIYGMTHRQDVRAKLQKAVDFIVDTQNKEGGWRYVPFAPESDMSIVVCQVLALRAARNIGIRVPKSTVDNAAQYVVDSAITDSRRGFRAPMYADEIGSFHYQRGRGSRSSFPLTAAGVTALHGVGIYSDDAIRRGLDYLLKHLESFNRSFGGNARRRGHYFFWYGHYYGVQAMYTAGTSSQFNYWEDYFAMVRSELLSMQNPNGSFPNDTGPGLSFGTAMAVLILEIPYRYLPIFQR